MNLIWISSQAGVGGNKSTDRATKETNAADLEVKKIQIEINLRLTR